MDTPYIILAFNVLLSVAAFFGGMVIKGLAAAVKDLQEADKELAKEIQAGNKEISDRLVHYAQKDEFREFRDEQKAAWREHREMFNRLFEKVDDVRATLSSKVDRREISNAPRLNEHGTR